MAKFHVRGVRLWVISLELSLLFLITAGFVALTYPKERPAPAGSNSLQESVPGDTKLNVFQEAKALQADYCEAHKHELKETSITDTDIYHSYLRKDNIPAGIGMAGISMQMWLHASDDYVSQIIQGSGYWERDETLEMLKKLEDYQKETRLPRDQIVFIDIGANLGWFTLNVAAMGYSVFAVEPMLPNLGALRRSICGIPALHDHITLINKGLSDIAQKCSFYADPANLGNGYTGCGSDDKNVAMAGKVPRGQFDVVVMDELFGADGIALLAGKVAMIKIDVEGFERRVFGGGQRFMQAVKPKYIFAEVNGPAMNASVGLRPEEMYHFYLSMGYDVHIDSFDGRLEPPEDYSTLGNRTGADWSDKNFYMVRKTKQAILDPENP